MATWSPAQSTELSKSMSTSVRTKSGSKSGAGEVCLVLDNRGDDASRDRVGVEPGRESWSGSLERAGRQPGLSVTGAGVEQPDARAS